MRRGVGEETCNRKALFLQYLYSLWKHLNFQLSYGQRGTSARGSSSTSVSPNRSRQLTSEVCTRFCTLMHNEIASSEQIPLSDPVG